LDSKARPQGRDESQARPPGRASRGNEQVSGNRKPDSAVAAEAEVEALVKDELRRHFRPEFLNRIDEVVIFHRLAREHLRRIVDIQLRHMQARLASQQITLKLSDAAKSQLAHDGYDPVYGARPLKRLIQQQLENPLARRILSGDFATNDTIEVDVGREGYRFGKCASDSPHDAGARATQ
jgi:ATP-dependent Clp protease ATP-binding subunit ClpA